MKVHSELGPGVLESSYEACLYYELKHTGLGVIKQMALPLVYNDMKLEVGYRIDLLVENKRRVCRVNCFSRRCHADVLRRFYTEN